MSNITAGNFAHRPNVDGTFDSICRACFRTIVRSEKEESLPSYECVHQCVPTTFAANDKALRQLELRPFA